MAYCSLLDVQNAAGGLDRYTQLTDFNADGTPDVDVVDAARAQADTWINGLVRRMYAVPFQLPYPPFIIAMSAQETVYVLLGWRRMVTEDDMKAHVERERELRSVNEGQILPQEEAYPANGGGGAPGLVGDAPRRGRCGTFNSMDLFLDDDDFPW